jgi:hypothetical protein
VNIIERLKRQKAVDAARVAALINLRARDPRRLTQQNFRDAAQAYGLKSPAELHAFVDVEAPMGGFAQNGRCIILYEPHVMSRCSGGVWDGYRPFMLASGAAVAISYPKWVPYKKGKKPPPGCDAHPYTLSQEDRWGMLAFAAEADFEAALSAASWGAFQILGENHRSLGWDTAWEFVLAMHDSEHVHLDAAMRYLQSRDLIQHMRKGAWEKVIAGWNGDGQVAAYMGKFRERLELRRKAYA